MKKSTILISIILIFKLSIAQISVSSNASFISTKHSNLFETGIGGNIAIGILLKDRVNVEVGINNFWLNSAVNNYTLSDLSLNSKYIFLNNNIRPYLAMGIAYYRTKFDQPIGEPYKDYYFGVKPSVGLLIDTKLIDNLFVNVAYSYNYALNTSKDSFNEFDIGVFYYFE